MSYFRRPAPEPDGAQVLKEQDLIVIVPPVSHWECKEVQCSSFPCPVVIMPSEGESHLGKLVVDIVSQTVAQAQHGASVAARADLVLQVLEKGFLHVSEGVLVADASWAVVWVNEAFTKITGFLPEEVYGRQPFFLDTGWDNRGVFEAAMASLRERGTWQGKLWFRHKNGEIHPRWVTVSAITNTAGLASYYVAVCAPIAARDEAPAALAMASYRDALTGLGNRLQLYDRFASVASALPEGRELALFYLDLDGFDRVNGVVGFSEGDRVLQAVAARLQEVTGASVTIVRVAADEFALLLPISDTTGAAKLGRALLERLAQPVKVGPLELRVTASVGIALYPRDASDVEELLVAARTAVRSVKERGGNALEFYNEEVHVSEARLFALEQELWRALERCEFVLHYQPRFNLKTGKVAGMEALVRWAHPERGLLLPSEFIHVAEQSGMIVSLGWLILRAACAQAVAWRRSGLPILPVAVNLSARQFRDEQLVAMVGSILSESGHDAHYLELEITETTAIDNIDLSKKTVAALGHMGVKMAIDDFGIGYGSLIYLREFPVQVIKLDRSFISELPGSRQIAAIVLGVMKLARNLECKVVAEGVETEEQLAWLRANGCDEAQGFLLCPPLPAEAVNEFILSRGR